MILQPVDKLLRMFKPHTYGYAFALHSDSAVLEHSVYIACRMPCGQYHRAVIFASVIRPYAFDLAVFDYKIIDTCAEQHFASASLYGMTYCFDHLRQFVCADMGMCIYKYVVRSPVLMQYRQDFAYGTPFFAACI